MTNSPLFCPVHHDSQSIAWPSHEQVDIINFDIIIIHKICKAPNPLDNQIFKAQLAQKMKYMINTHKYNRKGTDMKVMVINYSNRNGNAITQ